MEETEKYQSADFYSAMSLKTKNSNQLKVKRRVGEVLRLMKMLQLKFVIWVMDAGHIITLLLRFKLDNTDHQRSLLVQTMILQLMFGALPVLFSKW